MAEKHIAVLFGTAFLCFWLGYKAAVFANGLPIQLTKMDGLTLAIAAVLLFRGLTGRSEGA
ncbi:MAG: hypothetical protein MUF73_02260 [Rhodobacteraceae bacterium]|jgi:hypothetical protein|nr:hypothetical protein [Paracoccaceae bacterium]